MEVRHATVLDADRIHELISQHSSIGLMLPKTPYKVFSNIQKFFVVTENDKILGCVSLTILWRDCAEITSLAVDGTQFGRGIGRMLVQECIKAARELKVDAVFALTYQDKFFEKMGFKKVDKDRFPRKLWRECLECPKLEECDEKAYLLHL